MIKKEKKQLTKFLKDDMITDVNMTKDINNRIEKRQKATINLVLNKNSKMSY